MKEETKKIAENGTKTEPFFIVPSRAFELGLNPYELAVLFYLCKCAGKDHTCFPSEKSIARGCGMGDRTVRSCLRSLEEKKAVTVDKQYAPSKNGLNRQTANKYTVNLQFNAIGGGGKFLPPRQQIPPPVAADAGEINKTISNRTKTNITISNQLSAAEAEEMTKKKNSFLKLKEDLFEALRKEYRLEEDYVLLLDRALSHLWSKKEMEHEGEIYGSESIRELLTDRTTPSLLNACIDAYECVKEPVRSPVAYLAKCIFGALLRGEEKIPSGRFGESREGSKRAEGTDAQSNGENSFDIDDFFAAAFRATYG